MKIIFRMKPQRKLIIKKMKKIIMRRKKKRKKRKKKKMKITTLKIIMKISIMKQIKKKNK
jgi:hypothetical protein